LRSGAIPCCRRTSSSGRACPKMTPGFSLPTITMPEGWRSGSLLLKTYKGFTLPGRVEVPVGKVAFSAEKATLPRAVSGSS